MSCLPMKFVFGWLFTIDTSRVNEEARESVITYKLKCYDVLYNYFVEYSEFVEARAKAMDRQLEIYQDLQRKFNEARFSMDEAKKKLNSAREITFDKFRTEKAQYIMQFVEEEYQIIDPDTRDLRSHLSKIDEEAELIYFGTEFPSALPPNAIN